MVEQRDVRGFEWVCAGVGWGWRCDTMKVLNT